MNWREERLLRNLVRGNPADCWEWTGATISFGHGRLSLNKKRILAHRLAWELENGSISDGICVLHHCDNPRCCNPAHLFLGTKADNVADMMAKKRNRQIGAAGSANSQAKLTDDQVRAIRQDTRVQRIIGREYGISQIQVSAIQRRENWRHI